MSDVQGEEMSKQIHPPYKERKREICELVLFDDESDNLLWNYAHAVKGMVASNHTWGREAWQAFKHELKIINECIEHCENNLVEDGT